jgi:hypothetical protein
MSGIQAADVPTLNQNTTGSAATTSQRIFSGDISTTGQGRFTGWYTGNAATGLAVEAGISGGEGYLIAYNRGTSTYAALNLQTTSAGLKISGSTVNVDSGSLQQGGSQVLTAANYTSYAPSLTGTGASGTWSINVTGSAGSATTATTATNATNSAVTDDTTTNSTHYPNFVSGTSGNQAEKVSSTKFTFNPSTGLLTTTDYNSSSDKRLKKNIKTVDNALDKVMSLRGVSFDWKEGGAKAIGLIAQEAEKIIPEIVSKDDNGYLGIKYNNLIGVLVEAIKDQQEQINILKKQIEKL